MAHTGRHRPVTLAAHGVVAAPHYLAAQAGLDLLKAGGNAIDAAIAANATLQVVYPHLLGLGGDLFLLLYSGRDRQLYGLNASGRAPSQATIERYHTLGYREMPQFGIHSVTVPGCASGWQMAADRFGRLGLARALVPAIAYAEDGFPLGPDAHAALTRMNAAAQTHRSWRENFVPGGTVPRVGSIAYSRALGGTLRALAEGGVDAFYRGAIADQIADFFAREGGLITREDLAAHVSEWVTPLSVHFGDLDVFELPPNTQGVTALQLLGIVDGMALGDTPLSAATVHAAVEAKKLAFADRARYVTDPDYMHVDPRQLITPSYLAQRREEITLNRAARSVAPGTFAGDTIYLCTADEEGNAVSLIQSNYRGFGSGYVVDGTGIVLQNRGAYFSLDPEAANALAPRKRTLHTLIPSLALRGGQPAVVYGNMGGDGQAQFHLQVYTALQRYGLDIQSAIETPRWVHGAEHTGEGEVLHIESRFPPGTIAELRAIGHDVMEIGAWDSAVGHGQGIIIDGETGVFQGGADPRAEGAAVGW
jgi:gamma-glutamyltranspeptidase / glutathione hydrolase